MSAEVDVVRAWVNKWEANATIVVAVPGGLRTDEKSREQVVPGDTADLYPYAILKVTQDRPPKFRHWGWTDYRRVSVELYSKDGKVDIGGIVSTIHAEFDFPQKLEFPWITDGSVAHAHTAPGTDDDEKPGETKKDGQHIRLAKMLWVVSTDRTKN